MGYPYVYVVYGSALSEGTFFRGVYRLYDAAKEVLFDEVDNYYSHDLTKEQQKEKDKLYSQIRKYEIYEDEDEDDWINIDNGERWIKIEMIKVQ